jgi:hypothetical protein
MYTSSMTIFDYYDQFPSEHLQNMLDNYRHTPEIWNEVMAILEERNELLNT